jgi:hypothetical protein
VEINLIQKHQGFTKTAFTKIELESKGENAIIILFVKRLNNDAWHFKYRLGVRPT